MAKKTKFTDRQKKNIVKLYVECQNASAVARKYGCSEATVRRIVGKNPDVAKKVEDKKAENTETILKHMSAQAGAVCELLDRLIDAMGEGAVIERANIVQLATTLGILVDKYANTAAPEEGESCGVIILPEIKQEGERKNGNKEK